MTPDAWHRLSRFESFDYVESWYEFTYHKPITPPKVTQVNAFFSQGREFFRNASLADLSVKPLLLYYGILSLARGTVLLRDPEKTEDSLEKRHGLQPVDWKQTLMDGLQGIIDLKAKAVKGTFLETLSACPNEHRVQYTEDSRLLTAEYDLGVLDFASGKSTITLGDLLSRMVSTSSEYSGITGRTSNWKPAIVRSQENCTYFGFLTTIPESLSDNSKNDYLSIESIDINFGSGSPAVVPALKFQHLADGSHQNAFPVFHQMKESPVVHVVLPFPNGDRISEFYQLYLTSYILGMLARYYPSKWTSVLRGGPGDFSQPLLTRAVEAIEADFPKELSWRIRDYLTNLQH